MSALTAYSIYLLSNILEIKPIVAFISSFVLPVRHWSDGVRLPLLVDVGLTALLWSFAGVGRTARMSL